MHHSEQTLHQSDNRRSKNERYFRSATRRSSVEISSAATPLVLERVALVGEDLRQPLDHQRDERIRLLDGPPRLVHEAGLDRIPLRPITGGFLTSKDRHRPFIDRPGLARLRLGARRPPWCARCRPCVAPCS